MRRETYTVLGLLVVTVLGLLSAGQVAAQSAPPVAAPPTVAPPVAPPGASVVPAAPRENDPDEDDEAIFAERDGNEDGVLSGTEGKGLEKFDADRDGEVTKEEFLDGRASLRENNAELTKSAEQAFQSLDKNEDGRLSGTELGPFKQFDANQDQRVTKEEFLSGVLAERRKKRQNPGGELDLQLLATAIRTLDVEVLLSKADPNLQANIDQPVFELYLASVRALLGPLDADSPTKSTMESVDVDGGKRYDYRGVLTFEKGQVAALLQTLNGRVVGLSLDAPELEGANKWIYGEIAKKEQVARAVGDFYKPRCSRFLELVLSGQADDAFAAFHPLVQKQLDKQATLEFFERVRGLFGELQSAELVSQRITTNEQGEDAELSYNYEVVGTKGPFEATLTFQFIGMKAGLTKFSASRKSGEEAPKPTPPKPTPSSSMKDKNEAAGWQPQAMEVEHLQVSSPVKLRRREEKDGSISYSGRTEDGGYGLEVRVHTFDAVIETSGKEILDNLAKTLPEKLQGELLNAEDMPFEKHPGRVYGIRLGDGRLYVNRCVLLDRRMVQVQMVIRDDDSERSAQMRQRFVGSLASLPKTPAGDDAVAPAPPVPAPPAPAPPAPEPAPRSAAVPPPAPPQP